MDWTSNQFIWLDWLIIAIGAISITWAVWSAINKQKRLAGESSREYFLGGESWWVMGAAIFAANIGSEHLVGLAGAGAETGMGMGHWEMHGWMILIFGWFFVPFYKHSGVFTMPEFLNRRYTRNTSSWLSIITLVSYVLTKVSVTAFTGGIFMQSLLGIPFWYGAIGLVLLTGVFTVFGGMKGVMTLSKIQTPILIIGSFLVLFLGLAALGGGSISEGWTSMLEHAKSLNQGYGTNHLMHFDKADPLYDKFPGVWVILGSAIIGFWYWCTDQHIVQRVLGGKTMSDMRRGATMAAYLKLLPVFMFLVPGMIAAALAAQPESGFSMGTTDEAFGSMVKFVLPAGVKGIVTVGFICALVASLAAFFNSCATLYTVDFYKPKHPDASEKKLVWIGRVATWGVVILGLIWIPVMKGLGSLYAYLQDVQSLLAPAIVAVFVMGIFSKKITPKAGEVGIIVGFCIGIVRLICNIFKDNLNSFNIDLLSWFWNTNWLIFEVYLLIFIIVLMVIVSIFTKKANDEKLAGITYFSQSKEQKLETRNSWNKWDVFFSLIVVAFCIGFYLYFW